jgi:hypothetical protein
MAPVRVKIRSRLWGIMFLAYSKCSRKPSLRLPAPALRRIRGHHLHSQARLCRPSGRRPPFPSTMLQTDVLDLERRELVNAHSDEDSRTEPAAWLPAKTCSNSMSPKQASLSGNPAFGFENFSRARCDCIVDHLYAKIMSFRWQRRKRSICTETIPAVTAVFYIFQK